MKPAEMTTADLMEDAANRIDCVYGDDCSENCAVHATAIALRSRAARLRDELRAAEMMAFANADGAKWVSNALARVNAPDAGATLEGK